MEFDIDSFSNTFSSEPVFHCPGCNVQLHTEFVDNGFGPYSIQASPYHCEACGWSETGCDKCIMQKCYSWGSCQGRALISGGALKASIMTITRTSPLTGKTVTRSLKITPEQWARYEAGEHIQKCLSHLSSDDREFILTGILPKEWNEAFPEE